MSVVEVPITQSDVALALTEEEAEVTVVAGESTVVSVESLGQPGPGTQTFVSSTQPTGVTGPYLWVELDGDDFTFWIEDGS